MKDFFKNEFVTVGLIMAVFLALHFIVSCVADSKEEFEDAIQNSQSLQDDADKIEDGPSENSEVVEADPEMPEGPLDGMEAINDIEGAEVLGMTGTEAEPSAFPSAALNSESLLPSDRASVWTDAHPEVSQPLSERNFLTSTGASNFGINTQGSSLRNANRQFRSEPPNSRDFPTVFNVPTITYDSNRRPLEIGGDH